MLEKITLEGSNISAETDAYLNHLVYGYDGVFNYGKKLEAEIISNNLIRINDGLIISQGRFMRIVPGSYEEVIIENGITGINRCDLIVAHFETDGINEIYDIRVIRGEEGGTEPYITVGDTFAGATINELLLYAVHIEGINVTSIEKKFDLFDPLENLIHNPKGFGISNLLINGNLKVWLRGDSIEINSSTWTYTAEMFRCKGTGTVSKVDNGLSVSGSTQIQYKMEALDYSVIKDKTLTLSYSINDVVTNKTFTANSQIVFDIALSANDVLNWVVLLVGESVVEAPIPEIHALTLLKCARYCVRQENVWVRRTSNNLAKFYLPCEMRVEPTVIGTFNHYSMSGTDWGTIASGDVMTQTNQIVIWATGTADWYVASELIIADAQDYE